MMLHHPDHTAKAFSIPRGEKLVFPMVPGTFLFWLGAQVLKFQSWDRESTSELHSRW